MLASYEVVIMLLRFSLLHTCVACFQRHDAAIIDTRHAVATPPRHATFVTPYALPRAIC